MENNDSKKPSVAQAEPTSTSADRRAFMKTVVTGTVAAGIAASVGKAEAATASDACSTRVDLPTDMPVKATVMINKNQAVSIDVILQTIHDIFEDGHCPSCGLFGWPGGGNNNPGTVTEISFQQAFLAKDQVYAVHYAPAPNPNPSSKC